MDLLAVVMADAAITERSTSISIPPRTWVHASIALAASGFGFIASYLYLERSKASADPWATKMALHMAAWHLLLVLLLFPTSLLGRRTGARVVQATSAVFFAIHVGIAAANTNAASFQGVGLWIAIFNALSGVFFLGSVVYGRRDDPEPKSDSRDQAPKKRKRPVTRSA
jgi:hypothetical protein